MEPTFPDVPIIEGCGIPHEIAGNILLTLGTIDNTSGYTIVKHLQPIIRFITLI
jgi:hypothetical protein